MAVDRYVQDYDEIIPRPAVWNNPALFQQTLAPYAGSTAVFRCPATGANYTTNPSVAGLSYAALTDFENTEMLRDSKPHPDGKTTIAFFGGRVERGGVEQFFPNVEAECVTRLKSITLGLLQYAQDYDEKTPFQTNDAAFRAAVQPYLRSQRYWNCPDSGVPFTLAQGFRGHTLSELGDLSLVEVARDTQSHASGRYNIAYLDGYVEQYGPGGILPPANPAELSSARLRTLGLGLHNYAADNDGLLPPLNSFAAFKGSLLPYVGNSRAFQSPGNQPFQLNAALHGTSLFSYPTATTVWIRDISNYGDSKIGVGYLDSHVNRITP